MSRELKSIYDSLADLTARLLVAGQQHPGLGIIAESADVLITCKHALGDHLGLGAVPGGGPPTAVVEPPLVVAEEAAVPVSVPPPPLAPPVEPAPPAPPVEEEPTPPQP